TVKASAKAAHAAQPVIGLRLFIDGRPFADPKASTDFGKGQDQAKAEWTVTLSDGTHTLSVQAKGRDTAAYSEAVTIAGKAAKEKDLFVLTFAGHGVKDKEQFYLLPWEANIFKLADTALSGAELRKALGEFPCQVLLMMDACHSAGFGAGRKLATSGLRPATD